MSNHDPADRVDRPASAPPPTRHHARQETDEEFSAFYRESLGPLVGFLVNHGASLLVAADIAQEVMTDAYRGWDRISYPKAWVHKGASRMLVRKVASVEELVDDVPEPTSLVPRPDAITEWEARHDALPMLRSLPMKQRQVMAWTLAGFTPADIASHLGQPVDNVRANLKKARRTAAAYLKAREEEQ